MVSMAGSPQRGSMRPSAQSDEWAVGICWMSSALTAIEARQPRPPRWRGTAGANRRPCCRLSLHTGKRRRLLCDHCVNRERRSLACPGVYAGPVSSVSIENFACDTPVIRSVFPVLILSTSQNDSHKDEQRSRLGSRVRPRPVPAPPGVFLPETSCMTCQTVQVKSSRVKSSLVKSITYEIK